MVSGSSDIYDFVGSRKRAATEGSGQRRIFIRILTGRVRLESRYFRRQHPLEHAARLHANGGKIDARERAFPEIDHRARRASRYASVAENSGSWPASKMDGSSRCARISLHRSGGEESGVKRSERTISLLYSKFARRDLGGFHGALEWARNDQRGLDAGFVRALQHLFELVFAGIGKRAVGVAAAGGAILRDSVAKQV